MSHITLIRHGQANSHATTADDYDHLSPLGAQQAEWLGDYMRSHDLRHEHFWAGDMRRHRATAQNMGHLNPKIDPRLNEFDYFTLVRIAETHHGLPAPKGPEEFTRSIPQLLDLWQSNSIDGAPESFADFEDRSAAALDDILSIGGRALVITSGGFIAMVLRHVLDLDIPTMTRIMFQIRNSAVTEIEFVHGHKMLSGFNAVPHLVAPERHHARTFV